MHDVVTIGIFWLTKFKCIKRPVSASVLLLGTFQHYLALTWFRLANIYAVPKLDVRLT